MGPQQPGSGDVPPVSVLRQRRASPSVCGLEVLLGGVELAVLAQHVGEPDVQVAGGRERHARVPSAVTRACS